MAERSKALAQGASPQGRGFEPHSCQFLCLGFVKAWMRTLKCRLQKGRNWSAPRRELAMTQGIEIQGSTLFFYERIVALVACQQFADGRPKAQCQHVGCDHIRGCLKLICLATSRRMCNYMLTAKPAIAQLVEHLTVESCSNQMVPGSIPGGRK